MRWARERESLFLALQRASIPEKLVAYKQLEKRILKETRTAQERQVIQRRISMDLLVATSDGSWRGFSPYLRRAERLGYASMFDRLLACVLAAQASKQSPVGRTKATALITDIERRTRGRKLHPGVREEIDGALSRARRILGINTIKAGAHSSASPTSLSARKRRPSK
ncbi:hypothetical protein [Hyalangium minutum]|nr:hypothetical protein [Hyalangium minutum]